MLSKTIICSECLFRLLVICVPKQFQRRWWRWVIVVVLSRRTRGTTLGVGNNSFPCTVASAARKSNYFRRMKRENLVCDVYGGGALPYRSAFVTHVHARTDTFKTSYHFAWLRPSRQRSKSDFSSAAADPASSSYSQRSAVLPVQNIFRPATVPFSYILLLRRQVWRTSRI